MYIMTNSYVRNANQFGKTAYLLGLTYHFEDHSVPDKL